MYQCNEHNVPVITDIGSIILLNHWKINVLFCWIMGHLRSIIHLLLFFGRLFLCLLVQTALILLDKLPINNVLLHIKFWVSCVNFLMKKRPLAAIPSQSRWYALGWCNSSSRQVHLRDHRTCLSIHHNLPPNLLSSYSVFSPSPNTGPSWFPAFFSFLPNSPFPSSTQLSHPLTCRSFPITPPLSPYLLPLLPIDTKTQHDGSISMPYFQTQPSSSQYDWWVRILTLI